MSEIESIQLVQEPAQKEILSIQKLTKSFEKSSSFLLLALVLGLAKRRNHSKRNNPMRL